MKLIGLLGFLLFLSCTVESSLLDPVVENVRHIKATHPPDNVSGMWKKKVLWKPRWIKEWKSSNVIKPVWKKFWGPVIIREWVPIPKPPPQWDGIRVKPPAHHFSHVGDPPVPNLSYLQQNPSSDSYTPQKQTNHNVYVPGGFSGSGQINFKVPHLPITSGYKSQAETYSGQSSYGSHADNSAYDLNPPVEQFNPEYSYGSNHVPSVPVKPAASHSHLHRPIPPHHHHHHHHVNANGHPFPSFGPDLTKFPPDWNSWEPKHPKPYSSGLAQASSAVSIVSEVQSTTSKPHEVVDDHLLSQGLMAADNDFIQQAALVSEYHYTESPLQNPSHAPSDNPHLIPPFIPDVSHALNQTHSHTPILGHANSDNHVLSIRPDLSPSPIEPVPDVHRRPSSPTKPAHAGQHKPNPAPSHNLKSASPHSPLPIPAPLNPNDAKISSPVFIYRPNPIQSHKPTAVLPSNLHQAAPSSSPHTSAHSQHNNPVKVLPKPSPNAQNTVYPRKQSSILSQAPNGTPPSHPKSRPLKKPAQPKPESTKNQKPQTFKLPDFKALPTTSVEAFHFIEGFPSNQSLTRAALIGNINHTGVKENQVEIIAVKPNQKEIPPYVTKLAQAIVTEHLNKVGEKNSSPTEVTTTTSEAPTEKATVTIVYPSTHPFVRKTLKAYLSDESREEKSTDVFVVTPVPQEKIEGSHEDGNGV